MGNIDTDIAARRIIRAGSGQSKETLTEIMLSLQDLSGNIIGQMKDIEHKSTQEQADLTAEYIVEAAIRILEAL